MKIVEGAAEFLLPAAGRAGPNNKEPGIPFEELLGSAEKAPPGQRQKLEPRHLESALGSMRKLPELSSESLPVSDGNTALHLSVAVPLSQEAQRQNVYGFGELGMFGRFGASPGQAENGLVAIDVAARPEDGSTLASLLVQAEGEASARLGPGMERALVGKELNSDHIAARQSVRSPARSPIRTPMDGVSDPSLSLATSDSDVAMGEGMASAGNEPPMTNYDSQKADAGVTSLVVSGPDEALAIAVRTGMPEDDERLRSVIEDTAAEFGMQVSDLHVDGHDVLSFFTMLGGRHGNRAR